MGKSNYRLIAFIDNLGFKNLVKNNNSDKVLQILISFQNEVKTVSYFEKYLKEKKKANEFTKQQERISFGDLKKQDRQISLFSDLIVISYSNHRDNIGHSVNEMIEKLNDLQIKLRPFNVFVRGGISYGELYHKGNICFGDALIKAYDIESKIAIFPRMDLLNFSEVSIKLCC